jgi:hypothetical protein
MLEPGRVVRVRNDWPEIDGPCHVRTPHYVRGVVGVIERHLGCFPDPAKLAFNRPAGLLDLYHVRFDQGELWPEGLAGDCVVVEINESWLEPL